MAISFSRQDSSSPSAIAETSFGTARRGFDQGEVREYLKSIAAEIGRMQERERFLERELRAARENPDLFSARLDDDALTRMLGEETARVLKAARESATEIRAKAEEAAARMLAEASDEAARIREEADIEAVRRRADAAADAESELSMAKQQGREMVNEARAYRERVLSELARRRELAREQIEQLIHGRDRLMQAFERARLVAVDVVAELQPIGEPDEYIDLSPTTGPVPLTVSKSSPTSRPTPSEMSEASEGPNSADVETITDEAEANHEADEVETVETVEAVEAVETVETVETVDAPGEQDTATTVEASVEASDEATVEAAPERDVVVDLFARLRADTAAMPRPDDLDDRDDDDEGLAPSATAVEVGELDGPIVSLDDAPDATADVAVDDVPADVIIEDSPFRQRDADVTPLIVSCAKKLKRLLADEQNEVLDRLRRSDPVRTIDALLPWASGQLTLFADAISDDLLLAAHAGASSVSDRRVARMRKAVAAEAVAAGTSVLEEWVLHPMRDRLERCISDGDGDNSAITKSVRAVYREFKTQRLDEQLDDIVRASYGRGVLAAIEPGAGVTWVVDPDHGACSDCEDNALAGVVAAGAEFPTGHTFAPAHPGCRCLLVPTDR